MANLSTTSASRLLLALAIAASADPKTPVAPSPAFLKYWKSGLAELTSYNITAERYGEMRKAQGVMVFVYEEINADTRIKVESDKTPPAKRIPVLKLNNVLKFTTGVYDYSLMTSVFAGLGGTGVQRPLQPQKISFTSQEWCGNVFHQLVPGPKGLVSQIHSYFEAEGDLATLLPYPKGGLFFYEDEMPILVRELDGPLLQAGTPVKVNLVPGLWERRKRHVPIAFSEGVMTKVGPEKVKVAGSEKEAVKWTLETMGITTTYHVEAAQPHHLLAWENSKGEKAEMIASLRDTYWEHNHNVDAPLRKKLGLTFGVDE
ncbi:MAG: hypothetical protein JWP91_2467 [Fibrobacteres bacterium]|nr:hypothetical protein [Fibrobacterota bacterium]